MKNICEPLLSDNAFSNHFPIVKTRSFTNVGVFLWKWRRVRVIGSGSSTTNTFRKNACSECLFKCITKQAAIWKLSIDFYNYIRFLVGNYTSIFKISYTKFSDDWKYKKNTINVYQYIDASNRKTFR